MSTARPMSPVRSGSSAFSEVDPRFAHPSYVIKRPWFSWFERTFRVFSPEGTLALFVRHPIMKLRGEWQVFGDEAKTEALLRVKAQQVVALNYVYDITDAQTGAHVGGVRTKGLKSIIRDSMEILSPDGNVIGHVIEKGASLLRRFLPFLTSKHDIEIDGRVVATVRQKFRFFIKEFRVEVPPAADGAPAIDPRLVLTCALLALLNEAHREGG
ncbi:MAG: hypothetical protein U1F43_17195 [Myxococcota bacterium]